MTDTAVAPAPVAVAAPTSQLDFLRLGVRFPPLQVRAGTASCPNDPAVRKALSEQVKRRCVLLADGLDAACLRVEAERRAAGLQFVTRATRSGTSDVLPTGVCETCGEAMASVIVKGGKSYLSTASRGGMCELCALARLKNLKAAEAAMAEEKKL